MGGEPAFASIGRAVEDIDVHLSYKIVKLFSEGLYTSPHKAVEELVANSFDAGARHVHIITKDMKSADGTIVVIDDGEGMDGEGLKRHWLIGSSNKRNLTKPPRGRVQTGKFGIGKLATYVLAYRLSHISKRGQKYYSTSMDFHVINNRSNGEVRTERPVTIPMRVLTASEAKQAIGSWMELESSKNVGMPLFGKSSPGSWTVSIMSDLKDMAGEIQEGRLRWVLSTALPLSPDFNVWLDGKKIESSKQGKGLIKKWIIGKDLVDLPRPGPKGATASTAAVSQKPGESKFGLKVPALGRITGYVEAYEDPLRGKSDKIGRSNGFFVYVRGRLLNADDDHFGISSNELRHGTFSRFRAVVHINKLDDVLRSNREAVSDGILANTARCTLQAMFNVARRKIEVHDDEAGPGAMLAHKMTSVPPSLSRKPIATLARAVSEGRAQSRHLVVPSYTLADKREKFLAVLERSDGDPQEFVKGIEFNGDSDPNGVIARFDTETRMLQINEWHPFVTVFRNEFVSASHGHPLELFAMGEVVAEAQMYQSGIDPAKMDAMVLAKDRFLRYLAGESRHQSPQSVARALEDARDPAALERAVCDAFRSIGFDVMRRGGKGEPDGVAEANLAAGKEGQRRYRVSIEAKSKEEPGAAVSARQVDISAVIRHCKDHGCDHAVVVGPAFQTSGGAKSALAKSIANSRSAPAAGRAAPTVTLITVGDLAKLVVIRSARQVGLGKIRDLFTECMLPEDSKAWIGKASEKHVDTPPYRKIVAAIAAQQSKFKEAPVHYAALREALSNMTPPIIYNKDGELFDICNAIAQMSQGTVWAESDHVELDQSPENVIRAMEDSLQECERYSRPGGHPARS